MSDCASAMTNIGRFYNEGWGVQRDYAEALKWYTIAADKSESYAENDIGVLYDRGEGVAQDYSLALAWYYRAANKGLALAETNLASLYQDGHGVQQDYARAASWFHKAADQGDAKAQFCLGTKKQATDGQVASCSLRQFRAANIPLPASYARCLVFFGLPKFLMKANQTE